MQSVDDPIANEAPARCRPFTVLDAMVLVAATAVGLAGCLHLYGLRLPGCPSVLARELPMLTSWTVALVGLRLRKPRPERRLMLSQPGAAACATVLLFLALTPVVGVLSWGIKALLSAYTPLQPRGWVWSGTLILLGSGTCGAVVAGAWLVLAVSGLRRPEPGWLDRLGRIAGVCWVAHLVIIAGLVFPTDPPTVPGTRTPLRLSTPQVSPLFRAGSIPKIQRPHSQR